MKYTLGKNPLVIVMYQITTEITGAVLINPSRAPEPSKFLSRRELQFDTCLFYGHFKTRVASPDKKNEPSPNSSDILLANLPISVILFSASDFCI